MHHKRFFVVVICIGFPRLSELVETPVIFYTNETPAPLAFRVSRDEGGAELVMRVLSVSDVYS